jgi:hypothetical protein
MEPGMLASLPGAPELRVQYTRITGEMQAKKVTVHKVEPAERYFDSRFRGPS